MSDLFLSTQYNGPTEFVHTHVHTIFSILDGCATPAEYAEQCHARKYPAMSATEHGHMASVPDMHLSFREYGIKYIPACEIYFNDYEPERRKLEKKGIKVRSPEWRKNNPDLSARINRNRHLTVLCKNKIGYHNLIKLTTQAYETGLFGLGKTQFNRIWFDKLCEFKEGLIILSGCINGPISHELRYRELKNKDGEIIFSRSSKKALEDARNWIKKFKNVFKEDFYFEVQMPGIDKTDKWGCPIVNDEDVFRWSVQLADVYKIPLVLSNDCHYLTRKDFQLQKLMMAIAQDTTIDSPDLFHTNSSEQFMKTRGELWSRFKNYDYSKGISDSVFETMCDNTLLIADKCKPLEVDMSPKIPKIENEDDELRIAVAKKLRSIGFDKNNRRFIIDGKEVTYTDQAKIELNRFIEKGFSSYFLVTKDLVEFGKKQGWPFSPRGCSVQDSLITMRDGVDKKIIDIEIGDEVLDGFGDEQIVENKFIYDVSEDLIEFEFEDGVKLPPLTADHKLYIIRNNIVMLLRACKIRDTDEIINLCSE